MSPDRHGISGAEFSKGAGDFLRSLIPVGVPGLRSLPITSVSAALSAHNVTEGKGLHNYGIIVKNVDISIL